MPKVRLTTPFDAISGSVFGQSGNSGLTVFDTANSAGVARRWVSPSNPQSTLQMAIRGYQIASARAYALITPAQAYDWNVAAAQVNRTNVLNLDYTLSGIALFCMINNYRQIHGQAIISAVPTIAAPPIPTAVTQVELTGVSTNMEIIASVPGAETGGMAMVRVSAPLPSDVYQGSAGDCRIQGTIASTIVVHSSEVCTWTLLTEASKYDVGDYVSVIVTPLSAAYFPGTPYLVPSVIVTEP